MPEPTQCETSDESLALLSMRSQTSRRLHAAGDSAIRFITWLFGAFVASPTCASCGTSEARTNWGIDMLGCVHGLCADCAGTPPATVVSGRAPLRRDSEEGA